MDLREASTILRRLTCLHFVKVTSWRFFSSLLAWNLANNSSSSSHARCRATHGFFASTFLKCLGTIIGAKEMKPCLSLRTFVQALKSSLIIALIANPTWWQILQEVLKAVVDCQYLETNFKLFSKGIPSSLKNHFFSFPIFLVEPKYLKTAELLYGAPQRRTLRTCHTL